MIPVIKDIPVRIILFAGVDFKNKGEMGQNKKIAEFLEIATPKYGITLEKGEVIYINSPLILLDSEDSDIYQPLYNRHFFDYKKNGICIIYGYSYGGNYAIGLANYLSNKNINVDVLYTIDSAIGPGSNPIALKTTISDNVKCNINLYQTTRSKILSRGYPHKGINTFIKDIPVRIILFAGVDFKNKGEMGQNKKIAEFLEIATPKYGITLTTISDNVKCNINLYQTTRSKILSRGYPHKGINKTTPIINIDLSNEKNYKGEKIEHHNIDEYTSGFILISVIDFLRNSRIRSFIEKDIRETIKENDKEIYY